MDRTPGGVQEAQSRLPSPRPPEPQLHPDSHMDVQGYKWVRWRLWLCRAGALLSLGLLLVLFRWRPRLAVLARCRSCPLALADVLLIRDSCGEQHVVEVVTEEMDEGSWDALAEPEDVEWRDNVELYEDKKTLLRYYLYEGLRYVWLDRKGAYCRVSVLNEDWSCKDLYGFQRGLSDQEHIVRRRIYGPNLIDVPVKSYMRLLFEEVLNPFYVFQVCSIVLWMVDKYYYYASCILIISILSISISLHEIRKQSTTLRNMARFVTNVTIRTNSGDERCVSSVDLVPGDCLLVPQEGLLLPCDAALLAGECLVNESMLTGESVPVLKTSLPSMGGRYSSDADRRHTLFCGTQLIQAKGGRSDGRGAVAVVTSTGFFTAKGGLVSSILYPQPTSFRFYQDAAKFLLFLAGIALVGTVYSVVLLVRFKASWLELVVRSLDIVTIVVPPALPAALTTGTIYAQRRLKKLGVFCISPPRINVSGKVSVFCFDKTGTLTEEGLDVWGVMEGGPGGFSELVPDPGLLRPGPMLRGLACCHTVTLLRGRPLGDPLELKMVQSTGWTLQEPEDDGTHLHSEFGPHRVLSVMTAPPTQHNSSEEHSVRDAVAIVQRFPFSSALQRMGVVTVAPGGRSAAAFIKGSPEMVASLCRPETVPAQFSTTLGDFSRDGLRVLALGYKPLDVNADLGTIQREQLEADLTFLGLLMMKNLVKPSSADVITTLRLANLRTVMVTGDNILTAVNVAKSCGMVGSHEKVIFAKATPHTANSAPTLRFSLGDGGSAHDSTEVFTQGLYQGGFGYHLALNGKSFAAVCDHFPEYLPKVLMRTTVFARMAPEQKTHLVKELQKLNYLVGMCGDGANDCGALRAADVGVSLSEAEASVASPFTSRTEDISCVPLLIREGRCSLVTSFSVFRYMALYSIIQFCSVLVLYTMKTNLSDVQFLFCDLVLVTLLAVVMGRGGPGAGLHPSRPPASLLALPVLGSLLIHTAVVILGQVGALLLTTSQDWYVPLNSTRPGEDNWPNPEDSGVFWVSGFQYIIMAVVVTKGYPHKKPLYHNVVFLLLVVLLFSLMSWLVLAPPPVVGAVLQLYNVNDTGFRLLLVAMAALNFMTCFMVEVFVDLGVLNCVRRLRGTRPSKKHYKQLDGVLRDTPTWPPLNRTLSPSESAVIYLS